jgi:integration host factor subunit alpha
MLMEDHKGLGGAMTLTKNDLVASVNELGFTKKNSRRGRNPATGSDLILRERKVVTFKCSGKLRDKINGPN